MPHNDATFSHEFPALSEALAGQFDVQRELGRGGMGVVYLAREVKLDRLTALKVLPGLLAAEPDTRERFLREARTAALLAHPNIVSVYRADEAAGTAFFAMEYVDGESLGERLRGRGQLPASDAVPILQEVAWALAYAHARGVVHRDIKPENILLDRGRGRTLVSDFGIAHHFAPSPASARLTQAGYVLGSLHYMSPEQVNGEPLDGRSDLYSLGVVAYRALAGRLPFEELDGPAVLVAHVTRSVPPIRDAAPAVSAALASVVERCLAKRPEDRYATGEDLADALERALAESPEPAATLLAPGAPERLDDDQAAAVWRRAAQLQADALRRLEMARTVAPAGTSGAASAAASDGHRLADVASAAEEAGISRRYVAMALAELPAGAAPARGDTGLGVGEREARRFLGTDVRSVAASVVVPAPPRETLRVLGSTWQQSPFELRLRDTVGGHPLDGGVMVFDVPTFVAGGGSGSTASFPWLSVRYRLEAKQVNVTLRRIAGDGTRGGDATEVTLTVDARPGVRRNVRAAQWLSGVAGSVSGVGVAALAAKGAAVVMSAAVLGPAVAVAAAVGGACVASYRRIYPGALRSAEAELRRAGEAISAALRAERVFGAPPA